MSSSLAESFLVLQLDGPPTYYQRFFSYDPFDLLLPIEEPPLSHFS